MRTIGDIVPLHDQHRLGYAELLERVAESFLLVDGDNTVLAVNAAAEVLLGERRQRLIGAPLEEVLCLRRRQGEMLQVADTMALGCQAATSGALELLDVSNRWGRTLAVRLEVIALGEGGTPPWALMLTDESENLAHADRLSYSERFDAGTGTLNRPETIRRMDRCLAIGHGGFAGLLLVSLDRWGALYDGFGEIFCTNAIRRLASGLLLHGEEDYVIGRVEPDTLALFVPEVDQTTLQRVADAMLELAASIPAAMGREPLSMSCSCGVVLDGGSHDGESLLRLAKEQVLNARMRGGGRSSTTRTGRGLGMDERDTFNLADTIANAIVHGSFAPCLQPIVAALHTDGPWDHFEVLLRIRIGTETLPPGMFVPVAERVGLAPALDLWVLHHVIAMIEALPPDSRGIFNCNASALSIADARFRAEVARLATERPDLVAHLCLEITETELLTQVTEIRAFLERMREAGMRFAIDDFGSGSASFRYLMELPVDFVKLDGHLTKECCRRDVVRESVRAIVETCSAMGRRVIAESVETEHELAVLRELGVHLVQGYLVARPAAAGVFLPLDLGFLAQGAAGITGPRVRA